MRTRLASVTPIAVAAVAAALQGCRSAGTPGAEPAPVTEAARSRAADEDSVVPTSAFTGDTLEWVVVAAGRVTGRMRQWSDTGLATVTTYRHGARGAGPALRLVTRTAKGELPVSAVITGTDPLGAGVVESFGPFAPGVVAWRTEVGVGKAAAGRAFYWPEAAFAEHDAMLARALLAVKGRRLPLFPAGQAALVTAGTRTVRGAETAVPATLHLVAGTGVAPVPVWLDPAGRLFARGDWALAVVRRGFEKALPALLAAQDSARAARDSALASTLALRPAGALVVRDARLFDPASRQVTPGRTIVVRGDRVVAVGDASLAVPTDAAVVDAKGQFVLPGLADMHARTDGDDGPLLLAAGITRVRDVGPDTAALAARGARWAGPHALGPRLHVAAPVPARGDADDALRAGARELRHLTLLLAGALGDSACDARALACLATVARRAGTLAPGDAPLATLVARLRERGTVVDPVLAQLETRFLTAPGVLPLAVAPVAERLPPVLRAERRGGGLPVTSPAERRRFAESFAVAQRLVKALYDAEVPLVAGSDGDGAWRLARELELYAQAGIPNPDVLAIATLGAARVLGRDSVEGRVAPGMRADFVIVDGDPTQHMATLRRTTLVVANGVVVRPDRVWRAHGIAPVVASLVPVAPRTTAATATRKGSARRAGSAGAARTTTRRGAAGGTGARGAARGRGEGSAPR